MKNRTKNLTLRQIICRITGVVCFLLFLGLTLWSRVMTKALQEQQMAKRWSNVSESAQISCFFSQGTEITRDTIKGFEEKLKTVLKEESITSESTNENARMWADAYSAAGEITLANGKKTVTAKAIGVEGDFFQFHPLKLLNGSFFSGDSLMQDYVVIDEDTAWQLFGSNDVAGMQVTIGDVPHIVSGVIKRAEGHFNDAAGNDVTTVYLSLSSLESYGDSNGISCYEIVMPNPITGYALKTVKENIGIKEENMECIENTTRFSLLSLGKVFLDFGSRSMSRKAIIYPYWENVARGYEDVLALLFVFRVIFLLVPVSLTVVWLVKLWKRRTWTWRDVPGYLKGIFHTLGKGIKRGVKSYKKKTEKEADLE